jgi:hypothetical protein
MRKLVFGLILAVGVSLLPAGAAQADPVGDESAFVAKINELRTDKGLSPLSVNQNLVAKARSWAAGMAAAGRIWHSTLSDGITEDWKKLGENVGMGGSVKGLHDAFVASQHHYENLVDPAFGQVGIGIVISGNTIFVSEMFMQLMPTAAPPTTTTTSAPRVTTTTAPKPAAPKAAAPKPAPKVAAVKPVVPVQAPVAPPVAAPPAPPVVPVASAATPPAPIDPPRAPSALLVSVLERLRTFDS